MVNIMRNMKYRQYLSAIGLFLLATIAGLWAWNTLSELFNLPHAQYKHVLAAMILMLMVKVGFSSNHQSLHRVFECHHERSNH